MCVCHVSVFDRVDNWVACVSYQCVVRVDNRGVCVCVMSVYC